MAGVRRRDRWKPEEMSNCLEILGIGRGVMKEGCGIGAAAAWERLPPASACGLALDCAEEHVAYEVMPHGAHLARLSLLVLI